LIKQRSWTNCCVEFSSIRFMIACRVRPSSARFLPAPNPSTFASRYCTNHSPRYVPSLQPSMLEMSSTIMHRHIYLHTTPARCPNEYHADDTMRGGTILTHKFVYSLADTLKICNDYRQCVNPRVCRPLRYFLNCLFKSAASVLVSLVLET
jgi:hypothetical protein